MITDLRDRYDGRTDLRYNESANYMLINPNYKCEDTILAVLSDFPNLEHIYFQCADITDKIAAAILRVQNLRHISFYYVRIPNLSFLSSAQRLTTLGLTSTPLTDIGKVKQIKSLYVQWDKHTDLSVLESLKKLELLNFSPGYGEGSEVYDVTPLGQLPNLRTLDLPFAGRSLDGFTGLRQLKRLDLSLKWNMDLSPLGHLTQLEELDLKGTPWDEITDISALASLINLVDLCIEGEKIKSLEPVKKMKKLKKLNCNNNRIRTVKPLEKLNDLCELIIHDNSVRNVSPLSGLKNLSVLDLRGNPITDYTPLRGLPNYKPEWEEK